MGRLIGMAMRCQMLVGSYKYASRTCECLLAEDCPISNADLKRLENHPKVVEARLRNKQEYDRIEQEKEPYIYRFLEGWPY